MKTVATVKKDVDAIYNTNKEAFEDSTPSFHNLLWQILINDIFKGKRIAFSPVLRDGKWEIGIATEGEKGYTPTGIVFKNQGRDQAIWVCEDLNLEVFDLSIKEAMLIVASSMRP